MTNNNNLDSSEFYYSYKNSPPNDEKYLKRILHFSDVLVSLFIITPLVVAHWRGSWALMDDYSEQFPPLNCFLFGCILHTCFILIKDLLYIEYTELKKDPNKRTIQYSIGKFIGMRIYTYLFSWACNMQWYGFWVLLQLTSGPDGFIGICQLVICSLILTGLKSLRNIGAPPTVVLIDTKEFVFSFPNRFRYTGAREPGLYVLDCIFSVVVVGTLVVVAWRGVWVFLDLTLYPDNKAFSAWGSLVLGYGIVIITFAIQPIMKWACDRLTGLWRIAIADIFQFISFIGTVNAWRGIWHLLDVYFIPENRLLSDWITHSFSFILLVLLNCSNSVLVRGVYIDAEEPAGQCVVFPIHYIRLFFQKERKKKQKRLLDSIEKQDQNNSMFLLDKVTIAHNNIKIIKSNNKVIAKELHQQYQESEIKPILLSQSHHQSAIRTTIASSSETSTSVTGTPTSSHQQEVGLGLTPIEIPTTTTNGEHNSNIYKE